MKRRSLFRQSLLFGFAGCAAIALTPSTGAAPLYFDVNGASAGSGVAASGNYTWANPYWSTSANGDVATAAWSDHEEMIFAAGSDALGLNYTVTLTAGSTVYASSLTKLGTGTVTIATPSPFATLQVTTGVINVTSSTPSQGMTINAILAGSAGLIKQGTGILAIGNRPAIYTGDTVAEAGTLRFIGGRTSPTSHLEMKGSSIFQSFGGSNTIAGVSGTSAAATIENGWSDAATLTLLQTSGTRRYDGSIRNGAAGSLAITKEGAYLQKLNGANTHTGATTVKAGTLLLNGTLSASTVSVEANATFGGSGTMTNSVTLAADANLAAGDEAAGGTLQLNGGLALATTGGHQLNFNIGSNASSIDIGGTFTVNSSGVNTINLTLLGTLDSASYTLLDWGDATISGTVDLSLFELAALPSGMQGVLSIDNDQLIFTAVPEPSSLALFAFSTLGLGWMAVRTRRRG